MWSRSRWSRMFSAGVGVIFFKNAGVGSWSRVFKNAGVGFKNCWSRSRVFKNAGVGVGFKNCWSRSRVFKNAGVGVGFKKWGVGVDFLNLNNLWDGVGILKNLPTPQP